MVEFADEHRVLVPEDWTAPEFTAHVLNRTPKWLRRILDLRDIIVGRLGFATQPGRGDRAVVAVGESAGPFTFTAVDESAVRCGNTDRHIGFESMFRIDRDGGHSYGVLATKTTSRSRIGNVYLRMIWPGHRALMGMLLHHGMADINSAS